jgi:hypothetical protein
LALITLLMQMVLGGCPTEPRAAGPQFRKWELREQSPNLVQPAPLCIANTRYNLSWSFGLRCLTTCSCSSRFECFDSFSCFPRRGILVPIWSSSLRRSHQINHGVDNRPRSWTSTSRKQHSIHGRRRR